MNTTTAHDGTASGWTRYTREHADGTTCNDMSCPRDHTLYPVFDDDADDDLAFYDLGDGPYMTASRDDIPFHTMNYADRAEALDGFPMDGHVFVAMDDVEGWFSVADARAMFDEIAPGEAFVIVAYADEV